MLLWLRQVSLRFVVHSLNAITILLDLLTIETFLFGCKRNDLFATNQSSLKTIQSVEFLLILLTIVSVD